MLIYEENLRTFVGGEPEGGLMGLGVRDLW